MSTGVDGEEQMENPTMDAAEEVTQTTDTGVADARFADHMIARLNALIAADEELPEPLGVRELIWRMMSMRFDVSQKLAADHPTLQCAFAQHGPASISMLGLLNGMGGARQSDGLGYISMKCDLERRRGGALVGFTRTKEPTS